MKPALDRHGVGMVAVGVENFGVEDFVQGDYWKGELYVDSKKKTYLDLGYPSYSYFGVLVAMLKSSTRAAVSKTRALGIGGNLSGDGLQKGGALVVAQGGRLLLSYRQEALGAHVEPADVLRSLNIPVEELQVKS